MYYLQIVIDKLQGDISKNTGSSYETSTSLPSSEGNTKFTTPSLGSLLSVLMQSRKPDDTDKSELDKYLSEPNCDTHSNPLQWWKEHQNAYPTLGKLAKKYLSMCATSCASERLFSAAGHICNSKRSSMTPDHLDQMVFLYVNL
jgi:hypothetical protein